MFSRLSLLTGWQAARNNARRSPYLPCRYVLACMLR
jgi:hypothetical protein